MPQSDSGVTLLVVALLVLLVRVVALGDSKTPAARAQRPASRLPSLPSGPFANSPAQIPPSSKDCTRTPAADSNQGPGDSKVFRLKV